VIIALTALYALAVRAQHYGLTVERFWAFVVAGAALIYAAGYAVASVGNRAWFAGIARVNIIAAVVLILVLTAALTPLLSPYRLAADSQFRIAVMLPPNSFARAEQRSTPFHYLRFDSGRYGRRRLEELAQLQGYPNAQQIRRLATSAIAQKNSWQPGIVQDIDQLVANLPVYPPERSLDAELARKLIADLKGNASLINTWLSDGNAAGIYIDLNGDENDDFVLLTAGRGLAYEKRDGQWQQVGTLYPQAAGATWQSLAQELAKNHFSALTARWKDLAVGKHTFRMTPLATHTAAPGVE
jgi:hypothetical protein